MPGALLAGPAAAAAIDSALGLFAAGGPVMWPILACSIIGAAVAIERLIAFARYNAANLAFRQARRAVIEHTRAGRWEEAGRAAEEAESPVCRILAEALACRDTGFLETLRAASQKELNRLRRGLSALDTIITAAPMLGILGTVTGIINTFARLDPSSMDNPAGATAGIAEALITTAAGLSVALACLFPFNFLVSQINRRAIELEQTAHQMEIAYNAGMAIRPPPGKKG